MKAEGGNTASGNDNENQGGGSTASGNDNVNDNENQGGGGNGSVTPSDPGTGDDGDEG